MPALADPSDPRSWYARSRSRVATAILLTAPGIPQLFMGQEFLEPNPWDINPSGPNLLVWDGLDAGDSVMRDHLRFTQDLLGLRANQPALRGDTVSAYYVSDADRVLAFHRWLPTGQDVIVVATFGRANLVELPAWLPAAGRLGRGVQQRRLRQLPQPTGRRQWRRHPGRGAADAWLRCFGDDGDPGQRGRGVRARVSGMAAGSLAADRR